MNTNTWVKKVKEYFETWIDDGVEESILEMDRLEEDREGHLAIPEKTEQETEK
jgi:hypothetical protein